MTNTLAFGKLPGLHGGAIWLANGTVAAMTNGGSFAVQLSSAGSQQMRNILAPIINVLDAPYGTGVVAQGVGSSNGYITVNIWNDNGAGSTTSVRGGTVDISFLVIGGGGSI